MTFPNWVLATLAHGPARDFANVQSGLLFGGRRRLKKLQRLKQEEERKRKKRERRRKKQERTWSPESLAQKGVDESENTGPVQKKFPGKKKAKSIPLRTVKRSLIVLLKRLYGYALFSGGASPKSLVRQFGDGIEDDRRGPQKNQENLEKEANGKMIPHRTPRNPFVYLLEKMYGYAIMSSMISLFNKLEWKSREAIAGSGKGPGKEEGRVSEK